MGMADIIVDGDRMVLGRLASSVVRMLKKGDRVFIVNANGVVISGNPRYIFTRYREKMDRGDPYAGPFFPKRPDMIVKRTVRGMLPYKKNLGKEAFKRLRVFTSVPGELKNRKIEKLSEAENRLTCKYVRLAELSSKLGARR